MPSCVVIVGGWAHPGEQTGPPLAEALESFGLRSEVVADLDAAAGLIDAGTDLVVVHACYFQMLDARYNDDQRRAYASLTPEPLRHAIGAHLEAGRPLLAMHTAPISFDDWPQWPGPVSYTHLATELAEFNINVNAICPATIRPGEGQGSGMVQGLSKVMDMTPEDAYETFSAQGNMAGDKWRCEMQNITDAVLFLSSANADMITGSIIPVDCGQMAR